MTASLSLTCLAAAALIAFGVSALCALGLGLGRSALDRCAPAAEARVVLGLALLPAASSLAVMAAALAPLFGWIADHCVTSADPHALAHPHICVHHAEAWPALPVMLLAGLLVLRVCHAAARLSLLGGSSLRAERRLSRLALPSELAGVRVLPSDEPQAFVLGVLRPAVFVTLGLLAPQHREHLQTVLAHERAHLRRGDAARRVVARLGLAFHLPGVAAVLEQRLARAHEMAADEEASATVGSRERVARALVRLARARAELPRTLLAFHASDIELRVRALLGPPRRGAAPGRAVLACAGAVAALGLAGAAEPVHHGIEMALGLLSGL